MPFTQVEHIHTTAGDVIQVLLKNEHLTPEEIDHLIFLKEVIDILFYLFTEVN